MQASTQITHSCGGIYDDGPEAMVTLMRGGFPITGWLKSAVLGAPVSLPGLS